MSDKLKGYKVSEIKKTFLDNKIAAIGLAVAVVLFVGFVVFMSVKSNTSKSNELAKKLIDEYGEILKRDGGYEARVSARYKDKEYKYSYVDAVDVYFYQNKANDFKDSPEVFIQEYKSNVEAEAKVKFLAKRDEKFHEKFDGTIFGVTGDFNSFVIDVNYKVFFIENFVIGIKKTYSENYSELEEFFRNNINSGKKSNVSMVELEEYWNSQIDSLLSLYGEKSDEYVAETTEKVLSYLKKLDECSTAEQCSKLYSQSMKYDGIPELQDAMNQVKEKFSSLVISVIDFGTLSFGDAQSWCSSNGLECSVSQEYSDDVPNGMLISQSVGKDSYILKTDSIRIVYSKGKEPSLEFRNALKQAGNYLRAMPFSYEGLIKQLQFEGYSYEAAVYAADNCGANWYEQAAKKAQSYLNVMAFSRQGLINQLLFEGFTYDQAEYGVTQVGY